MNKTREEWKEFLPISWGAKMLVSMGIDILNDWQEEVEALLKDHCDEDAEIRRLALTVLPKIEVNGNADGVPSVVDIVEKLTEKIEQVRSKRDAEIAALQAENKKLFNENCELQENRSKSNLIAQRREEVIQNLNKEIDRLTACVEPVNYPVYDKIDLIEKIAELEKTVQMVIKNKIKQSSLLDEGQVVISTKLLAPECVRIIQENFWELTGNKNVPVGVSDPQK